MLLSSSYFELPNTSFQKSWPLFIDIFPQFKAETNGFLNSEAQCWTRRPACRAVRLADKEAP